MSYILDALRRADAERGRSASTLAPLPASIPHRAGASRSVVRWGLSVGALVVLVVLVAVAALWYPGHPAQTPVAHRAEAPTPITTTPAAAPMPPQASPPIFQPVPQAVLTPKAPVPGPAAAGTEPPPPATTTPPASAPPLKVTGTIWSDNPALRMLIVNGKVIHEGQEAEPGVRLEVITPRSAVFNHQGNRFNVNF